MKLTGSLQECADLLGLELSSIEQMNQELRDMDVIEGSLFTEIQNKSGNYVISTIYQTERNSFGVMWDFDKTFEENEASTELTISAQKRLESNQ